MNKIILLSFLAATFLAVNPVDAQVTTTQTTFSSAPTASAANNTLCVASSTGISAPGFGNPAMTGIMAGREFMLINSATSSSTCWVVTRGYAGTPVTAHSTSEIVWVGPTGGFGSSPFINLPPQGGVGSSCTSTSQEYLPRIVVGGSGYESVYGQVWTCPASGAGANGWQIISTPLLASPMLTDFEIFVPASSFCAGSTTGTAGAGNNTTILDGSVAALKVSATNAAGSHENFDCNLTAALRTASGKGITLNSVAVIYSVQTTTATSMATPTISYFAAPAAGTSETASSATLVTTTALVGGTLTMLPAVASANLTAVSAGQYYTQNISLGTPLTMNTDLRTYVLHFEIDQSASAAQIVTVPGMWLRGTQIPF